MYRRVASTVPSCRRGSADSRASVSVDTPPDGAIIHGPPDWVVVGSPCKSTLERPQDATRIRSGSIRNRGPSVRAGGFFTAIRSGTVFENSTACEYVETSSLAAVPCAPAGGERHQPRRSLRGLTFELK